MHVPHLKKNALLKGVLCNLQHCKRLHINIIIYFIILSHTHILYSIIFIEDETHLKNIFTSNDIFIKRFLKRVLEKYYLFVEKKFKAIGLWRQALFFHRYIDIYRHFVK